MKSKLKEIHWLPIKSAKTKDGVLLTFGKTLIFLITLVAMFIAIDLLLSVTHNFGGLL